VEGSISLTTKAQDAVQNRIPALEPPPLDCLRQVGRSLMAGGAAMRTIALIRQAALVGGISFSYRESTMADSGHRRYSAKWAEWISHHLGSSVWRADWDLMRDPEMLF
jgi:hypothetical protein